MDGILETTFQNGSDNKEMVSMGEVAVDDKRGRGIRGRIITAVLSSSLSTCQPSPNRTLTASSRPPLSFSIDTCPSLELPKTDSRSSFRMHCSLSVPPYRPSVTFS